MGDIIDLNSAKQKRAAKQATADKVVSQINLLFHDSDGVPWRAIRVGRFGWEMVGTPPIFFRRSSGMLPIPVPEPGGRIDELRPFLNSNADDFPPVVGWLLAVTYPILESDELRK